MHDHVWTPGVGDHFGHRRVGESTRDVVDDDGARLDRGDGHGRPSGVDARWHILCRKRADNRHDPLDLGGGVHSPGSGPGRLTAYVDYRRSVIHEGHSVVDSGIEGVVSTAIGERIRRHVENAHDHGR
jgi:hypothetical protein